MPITLAVPLDLPDVRVLPRHACFRPGRGYSVLNKPESEEIGLSIYLCTNAPQKPNNFGSLGIPGVKYLSKNNYLCSFLLHCNTLL